MNYAGVNFNAAHYKSKTEAEFIAHESHHGLSEKQLKDAYFFMPHDIIKEVSVIAKKIKPRSKSDTKKPSK